MILQSLSQYYERANSLAPQGWEYKEIPFLVVIGHDGKFLNLEDLRSSDGKKLRAKPILVPKAQIRSGKNAWQKPNFLWDHYGFILAHAKSEAASDQIMAERQLEAFQQQVQDFGRNLSDSPGIKAITLFYSTEEYRKIKGHPAWPSCAAIPGCNLTFRLIDQIEPIIHEPAIRNFFNSESNPLSMETDNGAKEAQAKGVCLVTGQLTEIERLHPPISGVGPKPAPLAAVNHLENPAFASYRKKQGFNFPVCKPAAFGYTTALNHLLARDSRQRVQVGDASTVFWAEQPHDLETMAVDLFGEPPKDEPDRGADALRALYRSVESGKFTVGDTDTRFHVLGLAPNAARISIRFWETAPAYELARRLKRHFDDLKIARAPNDPEHLSLFRLLTSIAVQGKADNIPPNLGGDIVRAILEDLPYPATLLNAAVQRCRAEHKVTYPRAAALKAWLNRDIRRLNRNASEPEKEFEAMLDHNNTDAAYRMGRLFAVLEKIQEEANPGINATIRDRYYGAASSSPATVFPLLLKLTTHHVGKLDDRGRRMLYRAFNDNSPDNYIGQILNYVSEIPAQLRLPQQGRFALGYYHQRQAFFTKPENHPTEAA